MTSRSPIYTTVVQSLAYMDVSGRVGRWSRLKNRTGNRDAKCVEGKREWGCGIPLFSSRDQQECRISLSGVRGRAPTKKTRSSAIAEGPRDASCQLKSCQLPRNSTETKLLIRQVLTKSMVWNWRFSRRQCVIDNVHSTVTRPSRFHCLRCVINKPTTDDLWISPVYRRLAVAKFSKSTI